MVPNKGTRPPAGAFAFKPHLCVTFGAGLGLTYMKPDSNPAPSADSPLDPAANTEAQPLTLRFDRAPRFGNWRALLWFAGVAVGIVVLVAAAFTLWPQASSRESPRSHATLRPRAYLPRKSHYHAVAANHRLSISRPKAVTRPRGTRRMSARAPNITTSRPTTIPMVGIRRPYSSVTVGVNRETQFDYLGR